MQIREGNKTNSVTHLSVDEEVFLGSCVREICTHGSAEGREGTIPPSTPQAELTIKKKKGKTWRSESFA
ncbi:MAG: hypothetical protein QME42_04050 [bacterium]|nr:hypothetical protein [bacterium]